MNFIQLLLDAYFYSHLIIMIALLFIYHFHDSYPSGLSLDRHLLLGDFPSVRMDPSNDAVISPMLTLPLGSTGNDCKYHLCIKCTNLNLFSAYLIDNLLNVLIACRLHSHSLPVSNYFFNSHRPCFFWIQETEGTVYKANKINSVQFKLTLY